MQNLIVGLDVGAHSIKAAVAEVKKNGQLSLLHLLKTPSAGIRRGSVNDLSEVTRAISQALSEIKQVSKSAAKNIFLGVGSPDFKVQRSNGVVAVARADLEIHQDDMDRVVEASQAIKFPLNRMPIHSITQEYIVDGVADIRDPLGMVGNRLEVNTLIIDAFSPSIKNLTRAVESAGGSVAGLIFSPIAASRVTLSKNQKELGVALLDIGFGKTGFSVYEEDKLLHSAVFPVGSGNITNDLAVGLKVSAVAAETIKLSLGYAVAKGVAGREPIDLSKFDSLARGTPTRRSIAEIIEMRLAEIFEFVNNDLKQINKSNRLPGGIVIVGGGAKLPATVDLARSELKLSAKIGVPNIAEMDTAKCEAAAHLDDPEWACALGLLLSGTDGAEVVKNSGSKLGFLKKIFGIFAP